MLPCISVCVPKSWKEAYILYAVSPDTIGQYTGLTDKNGVKIFEGDIISIGDPNIKYIIMWRNDGFCAKQIGASSYIGLTYWASDIEVLGNVIDNPELIKLKRMKKIMFSDKYCLTLAVLYGTKTMTRWR